MPVITTNVFNNLQDYSLVTESSIVIEGTAPYPWALQACALIYELKSVLKGVGKTSINIPIVDYVPDQLPTTLESTLYRI